MTTIRISELEAVARKATPGPWTAYTECEGRCCWLVRQSVTDSDEPWEAEGITYPEASEVDARYIASLSPAVALRLLEIVKAAKAYAGRPDFELGSYDEFTALRSALEGIEL